MQAVCHLLDIITGFESLPSIRHSFLVLIHNIFLFSLAAGEDIPEATFRFLQPPVTGSLT